MTDARDSGLELDMLSGYLDGELTTAERAMVEARLDGSAEWRAELAEVHAARSIVRALGEREAPDGFWDRVIANVEAADAGSATDAPLAATVPITAAAGARRSPVSLRMAKWMAGAAAAAIVVVAVFAVPNHRAVKPDIAAVVTQHGAKASDTAGPIAGLTPVALPPGLRK